MKLGAKLAAGLLAIVIVAALLPGALTRKSYGYQDREAISAPPSREFPLGTDDLGRDRFARLLYGSRISILLAPAAAFLSTLLAGLLGGLAVFLGGQWERGFAFVTDLFLSLPWLFLLLAARALLPLNVSPETSVLVTFGLLGCLGWPAPARIVRSAMRGLLKADFLVQARASGSTPARVFARQLLPNLRPILLAQFWISIPLFVLSEANLGMLGLGVAEPLPSWGSLLKELENYTAIAHSPGMLAPALLLALFVSCFQIVLRTEEPA